MKKHDILLRILSLLLAFLLWLVVMAQEDIDRTTTFGGMNITVQGKNEIAEQYGLSVISLSTQTADLRVTGAASIIGDSRVRSDITVTADIGTLSEIGEYDIPLAATSARRDIELSRLTPSTVRVRVDKISRKTVPVKIGEVTGVVAAGYRAGEPQAAVDSIVVEGPSGDLEQVASAYVFFTKTEQTAPLVENCKVMLYDSVGNPIDSPYVKSLTADVSVSLPVYRITSLPLTVSLKDETGLLKSRAKVEITPERINVIGDEVIYRNLSEISLGEVELTTANPNTTLNLPIKLPEGLSLDVGEPQTAAVSVSIEGLISKSYEVSGFRISDAAAEGDLQAAVQDEKVEVSLRGDTASLGAFDAQKLYVLVELNTAELGEGVHKIKARVQAEDLPQTVYLLTREVEVSVEIKPKQGQTNEGAAAPDEQPVAGPEKPAEPAAKPEDAEKAEDAV